MDWIAEHWPWLIPTLGLAATVARWLSRTHRDGKTAAGDWWRSLISFLAAPVERDIAQREAKALREDNQRLAGEVNRLRALLYGGASNAGSSGRGDGTPTSPSASSTSTNDSTEKP